MLYPDIVRADFRSNRDKALRALARYLADSLQALFLPDEREITDKPWLNACLVPGGLPAGLPDTPGFHWVALLTLVT